MKTIAEESGDGGDRRKRRIRMVERFIKRAGDHGLSTLEIKDITDYSAGLTGKKVEDIIQLLKRLKKIRLNSKRRWISI